MKKIIAVVAGILALFLIAQSSLADGPTNTAVTTAQALPALAADPAQQSPTESNCLLCHADSEREIEFPSTERLPIQVDAAVLAGSVHGQPDEPLACESCHRPASDYRLPHAPVTAANLRSYQIEGAAQCQACHVDSHPSAHPGLASESPVVCTDCHGSHDVASADDFQTAEGAAVCVDCHTDRGVQTTDPAVLINLVQQGFFNDEEPTSDYCLACHSQPEMVMTFANGDTTSLTIDPAAFAGSVHGDSNEWQPLECNNCHEGVRYPHEPIKATSLREYNLERYPVCQQCHEHNYELAVDSVHGDAIAAGNANAAVCTDCHHTHDTPPPSEPRERISHTCEQCHSTIFNVYSESVHGDALLNEGNPDVPTCIECHGVHNINDPTTAMARVRSPQLCAGCHENEELMAKYDISTEVFDTYVADFHGTTVALFEHEDPNAETNKAVCYDCHGVHNIKKPEDPEAGIKANLLETCQKCHPDATASFSDAWTSHFQPSLEHNPVVYLVNLFYQLIIPGTVGFFGFLVLTDVYRRLRERAAGKSHE